MKKFLIILGVLMLLIIGALVAIPMIFQAELQQLALDEANKTVKAEVTMGNFDLSLIPNFPKLTVEITDLAVNGKGDFSEISLFKAQTITTTLDLAKLYNGEIEIQEIGLSGVHVYVSVLKDGTANYDITLPEEVEPIAGEDALMESVPTPEVATGETEEETEFQMKLQRYFIHDFNLIYEDQQGDMYFEMKNLNHEGKGDFTLAQFILETSTQIESMSFKMDGDALLKKASLNSEINMAMDMDQMRFQFDTTFIQLNALILNIDGWLAMPGDSMDMDLKMASRNNSFKELFSLIPNAYIADYQDVKVKGSMSFHADFDGVYYEELMPAFDIGLEVKNGSVQYPDLPATAKNIGIDLRINSPAGDMGRMEVNLKKAHLELADNFFDMSLLVKKTITNPTMTGNFKMDFDLATIPTMMPVEEGESYSGKLKTDLNFKADLNSLDNEHYDKMEAHGSFEAWNIEYDDGTGGIPMEIQHVAMNFDMNKVDLMAFDALVGKSDIHATGILENFIPWYMSDETILGVVDFHSNYFDADEWMEDEPETAEEMVVTTEENSVSSNQTGEQNTGTEIASTDTAVAETYEIPTNIQFVMNSNMKRIAYDSMDIQNLLGTIKIENGQVFFEGVSIEMFEGKASMDGVFDPTTHPAAPSFDFKMGIQDWSINTLANTYNSIAKLAPLLQDAKGTFSSSVHTHGILDGNLEPIMEKLSFAGDASTNKIEINNKNLERLNTVTKSKNFNPMKAEDMKISFKCLNGVLEVDPFDVKLGTQLANVSGYSNLDQDINYLIKTKLKTSEMGAGADALIGQINKALSSNGVKAEVPDLIPVVISVTGKMDDPQFKPVFGEGEQSDVVKNQVKELVKEKIEEVKKDLKKEAQKEADQIMKDAKKQQAVLMAEAQKQSENLKLESKKLGTQLRKEAEKQGKELIKQATNPLTKIAAKKGAEQMKKEADKKAKQLDVEADKQGKKLVAEAKKQSDKILEDAKKRADAEIKDF